MELAINSAEDQIILAVPTGIDGEALRVHDIEELVCVILDGLTYPGDGPEELSPLVPATGQLGRKSSMTLKFCGFGSGLWTIDLRRAAFSRCIFLTVLGRRA